VPLPIIKSPPEPAFRVSLLTTTFNLTIEPGQFAFTAPAANSEVFESQLQPATLNWQYNGNPVAGQPVTINITNGTVVSNNGNPVSSSAPANWSIGGQRFGYAVNLSGNNVSGYGINPESGVLSTLPSSPFVGAPQENSITLDPTAKFAYIVAGGEGIVGYTVDPSTGALNAMAVRHRDPRSLSCLKPSAGCPLL